MKVSYTTCASVSFGILKNRIGYIKSVNSVNFKDIVVFGNCLLFIDLSATCML